MTVDEWLRRASEQLADALVPSARLDAELILAHTLRRPRTWLHAHGDAGLDPRRVDIANARLDLRLDRVPLAYIIGHKEFYGRLFAVSPAVLIPRPESEVLVDRLCALIPPDGTGQLLDVGTGSGAIGVSIGRLRPGLVVTLTDTSTAALAVATRNAAAHGVRVLTRRQDLLRGESGQYDYIVANLPYVDTGWADTSPELRHEPAQALYAGDGGLALIKRLLGQAPSHLAANGRLLLEADPTQHPAIVTAAARRGLAPSWQADYGLELRAA